MQASSESPINCTLQESISSYLDCLSGISTPPLTLPPQPTVRQLNLPPARTPAEDNIFDHLYGWLNKALDFLTRGIVSVSDLLLIATWVLLFKAFHFVKGQTVFHFVKGLYRKYADKQDGG